MFKSSYYSVFLNSSVFINHRKLVHVNKTPNFIDMSRVKVLTSIFKLYPLINTARSEPETYRGNMYSRKSSSFLEVVSES